MFPSRIRQIQETRSQILSKPENSPSPKTAQHWLVACSKERTLVARQQGEQVVLVKIFEQGSLIDAQAEAELARALAQPGIVQYLGAEQDPTTNKPCVLMPFSQGENLEQLIGRHGPLSPRAAIKILQQLLQTVRSLHEKPLPMARHGVIHRDIKPTNIFLPHASGSKGNGKSDSNGQAPMLIDLEHAMPASPSLANSATPSSTEFTGGSHGYAPPEAYLGTLPQPGFDIFGLGATLQFMLTGSPAFRGQDAVETALNVRLGRWHKKPLAGQPGKLRHIITACLHSDPQQRPGAKDLQQLLSDFVAQHDAKEVELDLVLQAIHAGEPGTAASLLAKAMPEKSEDWGPRPTELHKLLQQREALLQRIGGPPQRQVDPTQMDESNQDLLPLVRDLTQTLPRTQTFLERFPSHSQARQQFLSLAQLGHHLLQNVPPAVAMLKSNARFEEAEALLLALQPGILALHSSAAFALPDFSKSQGYLPGPLARDPIQLLNRSLTDLRNTARAHAKLVARLEQAELRFDLAQANLVLDEMTGIYGGASEVAAQWKDRLARLNFYLHRIAQPRPQLDQLQEQVDIGNLPIDLLPILKLQKTCTESLAQLGKPETKMGKGGLRSLLDTLETLTKEFPHTGELVHPAIHALQQAMDAITNMAWELAEDAQSKMNHTPVPIRPVQSLVNRLDNLRMLQSFVDQEKRLRQELLDSIERLRMRLDQARTTRDSIARGAKEAMDKGHLTTALFDMARAVQDFADGDTRSPDEESLSRNYEEAKRRKEGVEKAAVENRRLMSRYLELQDNDQSLIEDRVQALQERTKVLQFLLANLGAERASPYANDLREVRTQTMQEHADHGEHLWDQEQDPEQRVNIAKGTLHKLGQTGPEGSEAQEPGGRQRRIMQHWHNKIEQSQEELSEHQIARHMHRRSRLWTRLLTILAFIVVIIGLYQVLRSYW